MMTWGDQNPAYPVDEGATIRPAVLRERPGVSSRLFTVAVPIALVLTAMGVLMVYGLISVILDIAAIVAQLR